MEMSVSHLVAASLAITTSLFAIRFFSSRKSLSHIPGPRAASWWKGNFDRLFSPEGWKFHEELYRGYGGVARVDMLFGDQQLFVSDPLALHYICVKEQNIYEEMDKFLILNYLTVGKGLASTLGDDHRRQRKLLNPVFSVKHMRDLLPVFNSIAEKLSGVLESEVSKGNECFDVMNWVSRAALEYIGQAGFGYSFGALDEGQTNSYTDAIKRFNPLIFKLSFFVEFIPQAVKIGSASFRRKVLELIPSKWIKEVVSIIDSMEFHSKEILQGKRKALDDVDVHKQVGMGKDIMSVLLKANSTPDAASRMPESELLAHMSTFIVAGHDTTTSAVCRILHVLSQHQEVQSKLRDEVVAARKEYGEIDYDTLMALPYLDAICRETMRVHPPALRLDRVTRKDTVLPLLWPIKSVDGKSEIKEIHVKKNTTVHISILGANRSKAIWGEDADEWKPERWLNPLPKSVETAHLPGVYSQMMTFLGGGRACIGFKFSETEMKVVLFTLLQKFVFEPGPEIFWALGGLHHPVVKGQENETKPQVPLKVSLVRK